MPGHSRKRPAGSGRLAGAPPNSGHLAGAAGSGHLAGAPSSLLLLHAAGFCTTALRPVARSAAEALPWLGTVIGIDSIGHGLSSATAHDGWSWERFARDALHVVDALSLDRPIGFGHSLGAAVLLMAEMARPGTFGALYCYEPVVLLSGDTAALADAMAERARRRRSRFMDRDDARRTLASKPPLDRLAEESLSGYLEGGLVPELDGVRLACDPQHEAAVYEAVPSPAAWATLDRVRCRVALACGSQPGPLGADAMAEVGRRIPRASVDVLDGLGHLGPMEQPATVAASLTSFIRSSVELPC